MTLSQGAIEELWQQLEEESHWSFLFIDAAASARKQFGSTLEFCSVRNTTDANEEGGFWLFNATVMLLMLAEAGELQCLDN